MIDQKYLDWIQRELGHLADIELSCTCTTVCLRMKKEFPELKIKSGVVTLEDGSQPGEHTWLETPDGSAIIDPTERQYHSPVAEYDACLHDE